MTCIYCAPLIALPAWHLASFPLPGSQDHGEVLTVICIYLFTLQLAWEKNDSSPLCRYGFIWGFGFVCLLPRGRWANSALHQWCQVLYRLSQSPYPCSFWASWDNPWSCSANDSFCKCRRCSVYKLKKIGYDRMPRVEKRLKSVPVGVVLHFSPKALSQVQGEALFFQHKINLWLWSIWPWLTSWCNKGF